MKSSLEGFECDVAVIGGGLGGVAAALAAAEAGMQVVISEETAWLGGQVTSQAVSALDEHELIETVSGTRNYAAFRSAIRQYYQDVYHAPPGMPDGAPLNPGNGWVSRLCFEPRVGLKVIGDMLTPHIQAGRVRVLARHRPIRCQTSAGRIDSVSLAGPRKGCVDVCASLFLDATELGDLLPLAGVAYTTGAETQEDTGEPHASRGDGEAPHGHPERVQSFTFCFLLEFCLGENHTIRKPPGYARFRARQPYSLTLHDPTRREVPYNFFEVTPHRPLPFWTYRRVFDARLLTSAISGRDIALINWPSNDYRWGNLLDPRPEHKIAALAEARRLSLGFLYWLQTEVRRDDGQGYGYPELRLLPQAVGTRSGLAMAPYIREARRIHGLRRIVEQDIVLSDPGDRSPTSFPDSVGIGWYPMDLHPAVGDETTLFAPTRPFQIPLGALIPVDCDNLLAACKNICTTHLTNGSYRLHPVEWAIGEAAGALAAYCCEQNCTPRAVREEPTRLHNFQESLRRRGVQVEWPDFTG